jgi:DNA-binding winged helix-turn-helix (wHTH) protein
MALPVASTRIVRFGVFEVDLKACELRKHGFRIKLAEQPFQVLAFLLERPGEIVTREELRDRLWPGDTFVDFDHGLNNAVCVFAKSCLIPPNIRGTSRRSLGAGTAS